MRKFDFYTYIEREHVIISENGMSFFYNVEDDSGWWGHKLMMTNITLGDSKSDVYGFSCDGICEFSPNNKFTNAFIIGG